MTAVPVTEPPVTLPPVLLNAGDFLEAPPASIVRTVIEAALQLETPPSVDALIAYYTSRLPALGLDLQQTVAAIAAIVPSARAHPARPCDTPAPRGAGELMELRAALFGAADAARHGMIEHAFDKIVTCGSGVSPPASAHARPGEVRVQPAAPGVASAYFNAEPGAGWGAGWRAGLAAARGDIALLLAGRNEELGLLLGAGMIYSGIDAADGSDLLPPGLVLCGPRATLPPGRYWLDADIWLGGMDRLQLDIASNRGLRRLADLELRGPFRMALGFAVGPEDEALEVRLTNATGAPLAARINRLAIRT